MGRLHSEEFAKLSAMGEVSLEQAIGMHLQNNHYPPIPLSMVDSCIEAIDAGNEGDIDREIKMPEGVTYRGETTAPAWAIIEQHHLDNWIEREED